MNGESVAESVCVFCVEVAYVLQQAHKSRGEANRAYPLLPLSHSNLREVRHGAKDAASLPLSSPQSIGDEDVNFCKGSHWVNMTVTAAAYTNRTLDT